jgi:hypothetical protein
MVTSTSTPDSMDMEVCERRGRVRKWRERKERKRKTTHDLLDNLSGGLEVNEALVDLHLEAVPGLGSLSARLYVEEKGQYDEEREEKEGRTNGLAGGDVKTLGRETNGALDLEVLVLGAVDKVSADCFAKRTRKGSVYCSSRRASRAVVSLARSYALSLASHPLSPSQTRSSSRFTSPPSISLIPSQLLLHTSYRFKNKSRRVGVPFSRFLTLREVRVMRILWLLTAGAEASKSFCLSAAT